MAQAGFKRGAAGETPADLLARLGPTLLVDLGLKSRGPSNGPPDLQLKGVRALIDSGAGGDCIDDDLARSLALPVTDEGEVSGVGGKHWAAVYLARLWIPPLGRLLFQPFTGVKLSQGEQWRRIILGRSFLRQHKLTYDGASGQVEIL